VVQLNGRALALYVEGFDPQHHQKKEKEKEMLSTPKHFIFKKKVI
jgi:hypothetical protein